MANLVPLHIDKDTGKIVARKSSTGTGTGTGTASGFLFTQLAPITTWVITHNKDSKKLITQIYDLSGNMILPENVQIVDSNTVIVTFNVPQAGTGHLLFFD